MRNFDLLLPQPGRFVVIAALAAIVLLLIGLGRAVARSNRPDAALLSGWGVAVAAFVAVGTLTPWSFRVVAGLLLVPALGGILLLWRDRLAEDAAWRRAGRILLLAMPLILVVAGMRASQWDELTHWLPNGHFLAAHDRFPSAAQPNPNSAWPGYPYALPLVSYAASLIAGEFSDIAGILFNLMLLIAAAWSIGALIAEHFGATDAKMRSRLPEWGIAAGALLIAIPLNPSFLAKIVFTNYADSATACTLAIAALMAMRWLEAVIARGGERFRLAFACGFALTVLVSLRQANLVLFALLVAGFVLVLLREGKLRDRAALSGLLAFPVPLLTALLWRHYSIAEMPGGQFRVMAWTDWNLDLLPQITRSIGRVIANKGGHFGLMIALLVASAVVLIRPAALHLRARVLSLAVAVLFLGYTTFLFLSYVSIFGDYEAANAASFWRYSTHLGMIGVFAAVLVSLPHWRLPVKWATGVSAACILIVLVLPALGVRQIRNDVEHPSDGYLLAVARDMAGLLPTGSRVDLIDPTNNSYSNLALVRYQLLYGRHRAASAGEPASVAIRLGDAQQAMARPDRSPYVWVAEGGTALSAVFGQELPAGASYLLLDRGAGGYQLVRTWPVTSQTLTFTAADFE